MISHPLVRRFVSRELGIFLIVGTLSVVVDFTVYKTLLYTGALETGTAKACSFIAGTVFAYFANKLWTFGHLQHSARRAIPRFVLLYAITLGANVAINHAMLAMPIQIPLRVSFAFLMATGVSAAMNFIGMKWFVFRAQPVS